MSRNTYSSEEEDSHDEEGQGAFCGVTVSLLIFIDRSNSQRVCTPCVNHSLACFLHFVWSGPRLSTTVATPTEAWTTMMDFWLTITSLHNLSRLPRRRGRRAAAASTRRAI